MTTLIRNVPTLLWLNHSDAFLTALYVAGVICAILIIFNTATLFSSIAAWVLYLSLVYGGQDFLSFQWDILLLEIGFLAIFLAPRSPLPRLQHQLVPSLVIIFLFRVVLFKLNVESGFVKLASGDTTWRTLTATTYHYWTQPLPIPLAWYANLLPFAVHQFEVTVTFFVELIVPFFIFGPRRLRLLGALFIAAFQVAIALTGNFTFFNWLIICVCILLLDDRFLRRFFPKPLQETTQPIGRPGVRLPIYSILIFGLFGAVMLLLNLAQMGSQLFSNAVPWSFNDIMQPIAPLYIVNGYGLFAQMTTERPEIIVDGSSDGQTWLPYEFKFKVGDVSRPPPWVAPDQPRLDWQMWFAALQGSPDAGFINFVRRLLQGSPDVLALLDKNPFPGDPPHFIRALSYQYRFTDWAARIKTGAWWTRTPNGTFLPSVSLADLR